MKRLLLVSGLLLSQASMAGVWQTTSEWTDTHKEAYKEWMKTEVSTDMFTKKSSPYYGVKVDCADVTYALRAIFSYENGLPYQVKNPVYKKGHKYKYWTNEIPKFDRHAEGLPRIIAFANFLGNSLGTETLVAYDSYPIEISAVDSNDIYGYKKRTSSGFLRHAYNIVDVTETGNFQLIWSNQQRKKEGSPMKYAEWSKLAKRPYKYKWGFRRMNFPKDYKLDVSERENASFEQFELAKSLDEKSFFKKVKRVLQTSAEDPNLSLKRQLQNLCDLAVERVGVISSGDNYRRSISNRCMNYKEFDDYSTPGRDNSFVEQFVALKEAAESFEEEGLMNLVDAKLVSDIESLFDSNKIDTNLCPVTYKKAGKSLSLKTIYEGLITKRISSHPNDNLDRRWGVAVGTKTKCRAFY